MSRVPYHFPGITVIVPDQRTKVRPIVREKAIPKGIPLETSEFKVIRIVANIVVYEGRDMSEPMMAFDPPIEIRVGYNFEDVKQSGCELENLKLAYWDGRDWVIISDSDHEYMILPPSTCQIAEVKINKWAGDPPIGWGR